MLDWTEPPQHNTDHLLLPPLHLLRTFLPLQSCLPAST